MKPSSSRVQNNNRQPISKVVLGKLRQRFVKLIILPSLVIVALTLLLMNWHLSTPVEIRLTTAKFDFTVGNDSGVIPIFNQVQGESIAFTKFRSITLSPQSLEVADPSQYNVIDDKYPDTAWTPLEINSPHVTISGDDDISNPVVTVEAGDRDSNDLVSLDGVLAKSGSLITLGIEGRKGANEGNEASSAHEERESEKIDLTLRINQQETIETITLRGPIQLTTTDCKLTGVTSNPHPDSNDLIYKAQLPASDPILKVTDKDSKLVILLSLPSEQASHLFYEGVIPATGVKFIQEDAQIHTIRTGLIEGVDGTVSYPRHKRDPTTFKSPDFIVLNEQDQFSIKQISLNIKQLGIDVLLAGEATEIRTGIPGNSTDLRNTVFDIIWQNKYLAILFAIVCWVSPTILSVRKAYKEFEGDKGPEAGKAS